MADERTGLTLRYALSSPLLVDRLLEPETLLGLKIEDLPEWHAKRQMRIPPLPYPAAHRLRD